MDVVIVVLFSTRGASQRGCCPCYFPLEVCLNVDVVYISILYSLSSCFYVKILVLHKKIIIFVIVSWWVVCEACCHVALAFFYIFKKIVSVHSFFILKKEEVVFINQTEWYQFVLVLLCF